MPLDLDRLFSYHRPTLDQTERYVRLRSAALQYARLVVELTPSTPEQILAVRAIHQASMLANAAIAVHEGDADQMEALAGAQGDAVAPTGQWGNHDHLRPGEKCTECEFVAPLHGHGDLTRGKKELEPRFPFQMPPNVLNDGLGVQGSGRTASEVERALYQQVARGDGAEILTEDTLLVDQTAETPLLISDHLERCSFVDMPLRPGAQCPECFALLPPKTEA